MLSLVFFQTCILSPEENRVLGFLTGTTWGRLNDDRIFTSVWPTCRIGEREEWRGWNTVKWKDKSALLWMLVSIATEADRQQHACNRRRGALNGNCWYFIRLFVLIVFFDWCNFTTFDLHAAKLHALWQDKCTHWEMGLLLVRSS